MTKQEFDTIFISTYLSYYPTLSDKRAESISWAYFKQVKSFVKETFEDAMIEFAYENPDKFPKPQNFAMICRGLLKPKEQEEKKAPDYGMRPRDLAARKVFWETIHNLHQDYISSKKRSSIMSGPIEGIVEELLVIPHIKQTNYEAKHGNG